LSDEHPWFVWFPPRRLAGTIIGFIMFAWGRWITGFTRKRITERAAIGGMACMIGGLILLLWGGS
jgi:hypothetical protein